MGFVKKELGGIQTSLFIQNGRESPSRKTDRDLNKISSSILIRAPMHDLKFSIGPKLLNAVQ